MLIHGSIQHFDRHLFPSQTNGDEINHFEVCETAAEQGCLVVLQWAKSKGYPWDVWTCTNAAGNGHLAVLQWADANGCPMNS